MKHTSENTKGALKKESERARKENKMEKRLCSLSLPTAAKLWHLVLKTVTENSEKNEGSGP